MSVVGRWSYARGLLPAMVWLGLVPSVARGEEAQAAATLAPVQQLADPAELLARFPPFTTTERIPTLEENGYYPCTDCHDNAKLRANTNVRELEDDHQDIKLRHGGGRYWCLTCHNGDDRNFLVSLKGQRISFDQPFLLCGQCHFDRQRDYFLGGHGKRIGTWQGEKKLAVCTDCHDAHDPTIKPKKPQPPPKLRAGIARGAPFAHRAASPWPRPGHDAEHEPAHGEAHE